MKRSDITDEYADIWLNNKLINPITGRKIKENGPVYKLFEKFVEERSLGNIFRDFHI